MDEKPLLNEGGVVVTSVRFIVRAQTYAASGITSVKHLREEPSRGVELFFIIVGLVALASGNWPVGIGIFAITYFASRGRKPTFSVVLTSSSGEAKALSSDDEKFIGRVVTALNDAIVARG